MNPADRFDDLVDLAPEDSKKSAEKVAMSFYKIQRKMGFDNQQIISVATNMLDCLIQALNGFKEKSTNVEKK
ncbi:MAG: hypothetical protein ACE5EN_10495 [Nitrospinota bacterium]